MRRLAVWLFLLLLAWSLSSPVLAAYPAPWPDDGSTSVDTGWEVYTFGSLPAKDKPGGLDDSTGGSTPQQYSDVVSDGGTRPSVYYAYDSTHQVLYFRFRLAAAPMTSGIPDGSKKHEPMNSAFWSVLIDTDGDGFREFVISLDGGSGSPHDPIDNIYVVHADTRTQAFLGATPVFTTKAGRFPNSDPRPGIIDLGNVRQVAPGYTGGLSWFMDIQVPLSAFTVNGEQLINPDTPMAFTYATADSNSNPLQKDAVCNGAITVDVNQPVCFGDILTPEGGIVQNPTISEIIVTCSRPNDLLQARVWDYLEVGGGQMVSTVAQVDFYYLPDIDGDGLPDPGSSPVLIGSVTSPSAGTVELFEYNWDTAVGPPGGSYIVYAIATDVDGNQGRSADVRCTFSPLPGVQVSGTVYGDLDRNATRGSGETGIGVSGLYVKLVPTGGGPATQAAAVDPTTGAWSMPVAASGDYVLVLDTNDTLSDVTPTYPSGWIGTECPAGQRPLSVASDAVSGQDFGLWRGSTLAGTVFIDDGAGGGVPNDGLRQAGEAPLGGVKVRALQGGVLLDETTTDVDGHYILYLPFSAGGSQVVIEEINPTGFISVGGHPGTTGGSYELASDSTTFLYNVSVSSYTGVNFGDVSSLLFFPDNQGQGSPGGVLFYTHTFQAGTAGSVSFTLERVSIPSQLNWSSVLYRDSNGNGVVDPGESVVNGPISLAAGEELMLVLKEFIPPNAPLGAQDQVKIAAHFSPDNLSEVIELSRTDLTLVTGASGMLLHKAVDSALATSGDVLTYTITYSNSGSEGIAALVVTDVTPAYTTFVSAAHGPLPTGLSGVVLATPGVGAEGSISWTFTGILPPGGEGTVTFQVKVK